MMFSETLSANLEWRGLEGAILDGGYELRRVLEQTAMEATFRVRVLGGAGLEATAKFHWAEAAEAGEQLALWQLLRELPHRNVSAPLATGRRLVNGREAVYAVLAIPDDRLSALAGERALTEDEARELLKSAGKALGYLHANGLAHGCVSPDTILANGDSIQLAGECVRKLNDKPPLEFIQACYLAPECEGFQASAAADVWCLGATLFEALAQKQYGAEVRKEIAGLPLELILRRCLAKDPENRATLAEVLAILDKGPAGALAFTDEDDEVESPAPLESQEADAGAGWADLLDIPIIRAPLPPRQITLDIVEESAVEEKTQPEAPLEVKEQPVPTPVAAPVPVEARLRPMHARRPVEARFLQPERHSEAPSALPLAKIEPAAKEQRGIRLKTGPGTWRGVVAGAAALLMVAAVVWQVIIPRLQTEVESAGPGARRPANAWLTRTLPAGDGTLPDARRQPAAQDTASEASGAVASFPPTAWRVVLYAYEHQSDAERRVELVNHNHPGLRAHLFVAGNGGPYLVVTGDATSRDHAQALRKRALQLGVPHAHVKEFSQ